MSRTELTSTSECRFEGHPDKVCDRFFRRSTLTPFYTRGARSAGGSRAFATTNRCHRRLKWALSNNPNWTSNTLARLTASPSRASKISRSSRIEFHTPPCEINQPAARPSPGRICASVWTRRADKEEGRRSGIHVRFRDNWKTPELNGRRRYTMPNATAPSGRGAQKTHRADAAP